MRIILSIIATLIALIPFWLYLLAKWAFAPDGFWQNLVLAGLGIWVLGTIQLVCLAILAVILIGVWEKPQQ